MPPALKKIPDAMAVVEKDWEKTEENPSMEVYESQQ